MEGGRDVDCGDKEGFGLWREEGMWIVEAGIVKGGRDVDFGGRAGCGL